MCRAHNKGDYLWDAIPHTFSDAEAKKLWFNSACSRSVKNRKAAHKRYRSHPSAEIHAL